MVSESDIELYRKIRAYNEQFISYIRKKANKDSKVDLAINTLVVVNLYQAMALILPPKCPEVFQAQVDILDGVLGAVFEYLHSDSSNKETQDQLTNQVLSVQHDFMVFLGRCAGFDVEIAEITEDKFKHGLVAKGKGKKLLEVHYNGPAKEQYEPRTTGPSAIELAQSQAKYLGKYINQLVDYIMQKTDWDALVPVALMGLEVSYLFNSLAPLFLFTKSGSCQDIFKSHPLSNPELEILTDFVRALTSPCDSSLTYEECEFATVLDILDCAHDYIDWRATILSDIAVCYGIYMYVVPVPKGNSMELELVKYELSEPDNEPDSQDSQEAPTN